MTARTIGMIAGAIGTALGGAAGAFASRAVAADPAPAQATISAPALTTADLDRLRVHIDKRFDAQGDRIGKVETGLAGVQGYLEAQREAPRRAR